MYNDDLSTLGEKVTSQIALQLRSMKAAVKLSVGSSIPNQLPFQQGLIGRHYSGKPPNKQDKKT